MYCYFNVIIPLFHHIFVIYAYFSIQSWLHSPSDGWMREFNATFAQVRPNRQAGTIVMRWIHSPSACTTILFSPYSSYTNIYIAIHCGIFCIRLFSLLEENPLFFILKGVRGVLYDRFTKRRCIYFHIFKFHITSIKPMGFTSLIEKVPILEGLWK